MRINRADIKCVPMIKRCVCECTEPCGGAAAHGSLKPTLKNPSNGVYGVPVHTVVFREGTVVFQSICPHLSALMCLMRRSVRCFYFW